LDRLDPFGDIITTHLPNMKIFIRLVLGLAALLLITVMSGVFGVGGFLFTLGLFAVIFFAFAG